MTAIVIHRHFDEVKGMLDSLFFIVFVRIILSESKEGGTSMKSNYENGIFKQLQEVMERLDHVEKDLKIEKVEHREDVDRLNDRIEKLENTVEHKEQEITILLNDNERLKRIINNDSSNSSLPPSTDQKGQSSNTYNGRTKTGKKVGAQPGHKGKTLTKESVTENIKSGKLKHIVKNVGKVGPSYISKYILDLQIIPTATELRFYPNKNGKYSIPTEYKSDVIYGSVTKAITIDLYSEGVVSNDRICEFINSISGNALSLSAGTTYHFCKDFSDTCEIAINQLKEDLRNSEVVYTDGTSVTMNGKQEHIRNQSTRNTVLYSPMEKKNIKTLKQTGILLEYTGILVHDHETALYHFGTGHGECNTHCLRYLKKNSEETANEWSREMSSFLCTVNTAKGEVVFNGKDCFEPDILSGYGKRYDEIILEGRKQNKLTKGRIAKAEEKTLLNRLEKYKEEHLLFVYNFKVDFSNNISERDLRKCKNRQKMAGGFRKKSGKEMYCRIMSVVETCKRRNMQIFENICKIINGTPAIF